MSVPHELVEAGYAVGIGLVIGFEREHHGLTAGLPPDERPAERPREALGRSLLGARTFALLALTGWLIGLLGERFEALVPLGLVAVLGLLAVQYVLGVRGGEHPGLTTEVAAVVTVLLGVLVNVDRELAVPLAVAVVLLLIAKPWTRVAAEKLRRIELTATVQLLVLAVIVLPLLPATPVDRWDAIPPRKVGLFVLLIAGLEYVGYVLHRLLGAERGFAVAGLVGGLASSTAVTAAMARQARQAPDMAAAARLATLLANAVMGVRVLVVTLLLSPAVAAKLAPPIGALVLVLLGAAALAHRRQRERQPVGAGALQLRNPFALLPALQWGAVLCGILLAMRLAGDYLGDEGLLLAAAVSGLADVDAITLAASREASAHAIPAWLGAVAIAIAVATNTVVKGAIAWGGGGRAFGARIAGAFAVGLAAAAAAAAVVAAAG